MQYFKNYYHTMKTLTNLESAIQASSIDISNPLAPNKRI